MGEVGLTCLFFFSSRRRHTRFDCDWSSDVCSSDLMSEAARHTALTNLFTGRPARGIVNRIIRELGAINPAAPEFPLATAAIAPIRAAEIGRASCREREYITAGDGICTRT